jgi:hypothetical protein
MKRHALPFYRPLEFWAYWGERKLHKNETARGWVNHAFVMFTKQLWRDVGGYCAMNIGEDATFFDSIHQLLNEDWIAHPLRPVDRFFILRGKSRYQHMSIGGGQEPLNTKPGRYVISPCPIDDPVLRSVYEELIAQRASAVPDRMSSAKVLVTSRSRGSSASIELSVCVSLKNRSRITHDNQILELFPKCVRSLVGAADQLGMKSGIELVIADYGSDDWPLVDWLDDATDGLPFRVVNVEGDFSRGAGLNIAAHNGASGKLFLCDADMIVSHSLISRGLESLEQGRAYFPVALRLDASGKSAGWEHFGYGNVFVTRDAFTKAGGIPEFKSWGGEDDVFVGRLRKFVEIDRETFDGFLHQWHPEHCRHENYVHSRKSDYLNHQDNKSTMNGEPARVFQGDHPHWQGEIHFFEGGRMARPGIDTGAYEIVERDRIVLDWDCWPAEILLWHDTEQAYIHPTKPFSLVEQVQVASEQ